MKVTDTTKINTNPQVTVRGNNEKVVTVTFYKIGKNEYWAIKYPNSNSKNFKEYQGAIAYLESKGY